MSRSFSFSYFLHPGPSVPSLIFFIFLIFLHFHNLKSSLSKYFSVDNFTRTPQLVEFSIFKVFQKIHKSKFPLLRHLIHEQRRRIHHHLLRGIIKQVYLLNGGMYMTKLMTKQLLIDPIITASLKNVLSH